MDKPKPLKVFGRLHYACLRCKLSKIKCLGEKPACANCKVINRELGCVYPAKDRKIVIMELDLNKLHRRVEHLEGLLGHPLKHLTMLELNLLSDVDMNEVPERILRLCIELLPSRAHAQKLLEKVCRMYSSEFYIVDDSLMEPLTERVYSYVSSGANVPRSLDLCYFFALLAFGEQLHNLADGDKSVPGLMFYSLAARIFPLSHENICVQFIQAALVLGLYACNLSRYNTVCNFFGVAIRLAAANGYHRQMKVPLPSDGPLREAQLQHHEKIKRLWWTIFVIDVTWASKMNIPVHLHFTDTDVALPNELPRVLGDLFSTEMLDCNVHLSKFMAKFNQLIYGPNGRTLQMSYINTDQFNQRLLVSNVLKAQHNLYTLFEASVLAPYQLVDIMQLEGREICNLFLRYNQLVITVVKPLLVLLFKGGTFEKLDEVLGAIAHCVAAAARLIEILFRLHQQLKLFVLGFWDSEHMFSAFLVLVSVAAAGCRRHELSKPIALLRYMAENGNINARCIMERLAQANDFLEKMPEVGVRLDLGARIERASGVGLFYPFRDIVPDAAEFAQLAAGDLSRDSHGALATMVQAMQSWDTFRGLPIDVYGTLGVLAPAVQQYGNVKIESLI